MPGLNKLRASFDLIGERLLSFAGAADLADGALVVAFMSRTGGEGVTTTAVGLARSLAAVRSMRVLVVGYDAGGAGAAVKLGIGPQAFPGFGAAADAPKPGQFIQKVDDVHLHVLTLDPSSASAFPSDPRWPEALAGLRRAYDVILVDAGARHRPLPPRWGNTVHRVVLVVDTSRTTEEELGRFKAELDAAGQRADAVILSKRDYHVPGFLYRYVR